MSINISDSQVQAWIQDGIQNAIKSLLSDRYGTGAQLKDAMDKAIKQAQPQIVAAVEASIARACVAPGFLQAIEREIAASLASQYRGAFEGVVRAAAKQAANTEVIAKRVAELTRQAAGLSAE